MLWSNEYNNDCNIISSCYSLRTALCESIYYQAKSEQNVRQDLIPRVHHGEAALMHPQSMLVFLKKLQTSSVHRAGLLLLKTIFGQLITNCLITNTNICRLLDIILL